jgi:hypothetical protein
VDLGTFATRDALVAAVRPGTFAPQSETQQKGAPMAPTAGDATTLDSLAVMCGSRPDATLVGHAQLSGQPVFVQVYGPPDHQTLEVYDASCALLFSQPL